MTCDYSALCQFELPIKTLLLLSILNYCEMQWLKGKSWLIPMVSASNWNQKCGWMGRTRYVLGQWLQNRDYTKP